MWECPSGYLLFQETCYRQYYELKSHIDAHRYCENENNEGKLASPYTNIQVGLSYYGFLLFHHLQLIHLIWTLIAVHLYYCYHSERGNFWRALQNKIFKTTQNTREIRNCITSHGYHLEVKYKPYLYIYWLCLYTFVTWLVYFNSKSFQSFQITINVWQWKQTTQVLKYWIFLVMPRTTLFAKQVSNSVFFSYSIPSINMNRINVWNELKLTILYLYW